MILNLVDRLGDWNPQLLRELKGRFKVFPVVIAVATSLIGQLILLLYHLRDLPGDKYPMYEKYCKLQKYQQNDVYSRLNNQLCPIEQIDLHLWWQDHWAYIFQTLSGIFVFTLLVAGTYLLINNITQEERRGTLNFLRLTPQSETSILTGKLLGVPILIYLAVLVALPLHLWAGNSANIAFSYILSFYAVLAASCILFYSAALLFGLISRWLSGFQPWLGSGAILVFLIITLQIAPTSSKLNHAAAWFRLLSPFDLTNYLFANLVAHRDNWQSLQNLQFFYLPVGANLLSLVVLHLFNYGLWTYWAWEALKRCFRNPNIAILSKGKSYLLVACFQVILWGFTLQDVKSFCPSYLRGQDAFCDYNLNQQVENNIALLAFFNLVLLLGLVAILSPKRQTIQDWARYRHQNVPIRQKWKNSLLLDLIWGEKSPALVAMVINLAIATTPLVIWILLAPVLHTYQNSSGDWLLSNFGRFKAILGVALFFTLIMIYTTLAQRILLLATPKGSLWAIGIVGAAIVVPPIILGILGIQSDKNPLPWLFSTFPWTSIEYTTTTTIFMVFLSHLSVLGLLTYQLTRQVRLAGESATKALLRN